MNNTKTTTFSGIYNFCEHCESITHICYCKCIEIQVKGCISRVVGYENRVMSITSKLH